MCGSLLGRTVGGSYREIARLGNHNIPLADSCLTGSRASTPKRVNPTRLTVVHEKMRFEWKVDREGVERLLALTPDSIDRAGPRSTRGDGDILACMSSNKTIGTINEQKKLVYASFPELLGYGFDTKASLPVWGYINQSYHIGFFSSQRTCRCLHRWHPFRLFLCSRRSRWGSDEPPGSVSSESIVLRGRVCGPESAYGFVCLFPEERVGLENLLKETLR